MLLLLLTFIKAKDNRTFSKNTRKKSTARLKQTPTNNTRRITKRPSQWRSGSYTAGFACLCSTAQQEDMNLFHPCSHNSTQQQTEYKWKDTNNRNMVRVTVKLPLCLMMQHTRKTQGEVEVWILTF